MYHHGGQTATLPHRGGYAGWLPVTGEAWEEARLARMACFCSLPEAVRARDAANETPAGHLKWARRSRVQAMSSASDTLASGRRTTTAHTDSPHSAEGTPTTATSAT